MCHHNSVKLMDSGNDNLNGANNERAKKTKYPLVYYPIWNDAIHVLILVEPLADPQTPSRYAGVDCLGHRIRKLKWRSATSSS
jgi:hypothetical protein